jgi:hypothetical protein
VAITLQFQSSGESSLQILAGLGLPAIRLRVCRGFILSEGMSGYYTEIGHDCLLKNPFWYSWLSSLRTRYVTSIVEISSFMTFVICSVQLDSTHKLTRGMELLSRRASFSLQHSVQATSLSGSHWIFCVHFRFGRVLDNHILLNTSRDSSFGIPLGYGVDDRGSRVRFPAGARNFSHHHTQIGSGAHPDPYPMRTSCSFPGSKAAEARSWPLTSV